MLAALGKNVKPRPLQIKGSGILKGYTVTPSRRVDSGIMPARIYVNRKARGTGGYPPIRHQFVFNRSGLHYGNTASKSAVKNRCVDLGSEC
jgi:hypothetical protein